MAVEVFFPQEKLQVCVDQITGAVIAVLHLDGLAAVGAEERPLAVIPSDGGIAHIAVPGLFLGYNCRQLYLYIAE